MAREGSGGQAQGADRRRTPLHSEKENQKPTKEQTQEAISRAGAAMSTPLIIICIAVYLGTAASLFSQGQLGMSFMFVCYAFANVGIILATKGV
jgi:uncharacterized protein HemX